MGKFKDLTGMIFGRWTVIERAENSKGESARWLCECSCENKTIKIVRGRDLGNGNSKSCGCLQKELSRQHHSTHGLTGTRIYRIYKGMKSRCYNPNIVGYENYGGRNVTIDEDWMGEDGFMNFYNWSMENGYTDELTIDRIENDKGYSPDNCRWSTDKEQANNRRSNRYVEINGVTKTVSVWAKEAGLDKGTIKSRIENGVTGDDLLKNTASKLKSNVTGVYWSEKQKKWIVREAITGKYLGVFKSLEDAIKLRKDSEQNKNTIHKLKGDYPK